MFSMSGNLGYVIQKIIIAAQGLYMNPVRNIKEETMEAIVTPMLRFLQGPKQFFIPIFQRMYSWEEKHCQRLWDDILRIGENPDISSHFLGSIVYMEPGAQNTGAVQKLLVIDGQQRLTTLSLLLSALSREIEEQDSDIGITPKRLSSYYLFNNEEDGELRYKQLLTKHDKETLIHLLENKDLLPANPSVSVVKNYRFFEAKLKQVDLKSLYTGIQKLMIVDIALDRTEDNPQLIFESLNSTGLGLSQADLIRNYVLMGQEPDFQNSLYERYWFPMEQRFGDQYRKRFDRFVRDYLTLKTEQIPNISSVYEKFKVYLPSTENPEKLARHVEDLSRYAGHYANIALPQEKDPELLECFEDLRELRAEVTYPFLLEVYDYYIQGKIEKSEVIQTLRLVESYIFRRAICEMSSNFLNQIFVSILSKLSKNGENNYLEILNHAFLDLQSTRYYPIDVEFKAAFVSKDIYNFNRRNYLLRKLENYERKELTEIANYTVEHVMPQTLTKVWQQELGEDFQRIHGIWLHKIGNLTLTGYNSEYSNKSFKEKRDKPQNGFRHSPIYLNQSLASAEQWGEKAIIARGNELAERACKIWIYPE